MTEQSVEMANEFSILTRQIKLLIGYFCTRSKFSGNGREENYSKRTAGEQTVNI